MLNTFKKVFSQIKYIATAVIIAVVIFVLAVWLSNVSLVIDIVFNSSVPITDKIGFMFSFVGSIQTNFTAISASYTIIIAVLFGINISLLVYYIRSRQTKSLASGTTLSVGGLVSGVFGIGCATCGTFVFTSILALFGASGLLVYLPFGGEEFGFLGVGLLIYSSYIILKKIKEPLVCE